MFSRFNDVLQSAGDVLAPPPTPLQDFQYHWKQVKTFYTTPGGISSPAIVTPSTTQPIAPNVSANAQPPAPLPPSQPTVQSQKPPTTHRKCHLSDTRIPHHLEQMLQLLIREEQLNGDSGNTSNTNVVDATVVATVTATTDSTDTTATASQPCLEFLLATRPLDLLTELAATDAPPGARVCILAWIRRYLSCMRRPRLERPAVLQPVQRLLALCHGGRASPYETEEILFAATVAGLVRKEPFLVHLFLPAHQHSAFVRRRLEQSPTSAAAALVMPRGNRLFDEIVVADTGRRVSKVMVVSGGEDVAGEPANGKDEADVASVATASAAAATIDAPTFACDCDEREDRLGLLDTILAYADSADTLVILRACEGALMLATLPTVAATRCAAVRASLRDFAARVAVRLAELCERIPEDMDTCDIEDCTVSWGLMPRETDYDCAMPPNLPPPPSQPHFVGRAQLQEFLGWLDYTNCLAQEACATMAAELCALVRHRLLGEVIEPGLLDGNSEAAAFMLVLLAKIVHQLDARQFTGELATWLVGPEAIDGDCGGVGGGGGAADPMPDCLLNIIVDNAQDNGELLLPTLQFVEALIDNCNGRILHGMLFRYVNTRGYYDAQAAGRMVRSWSDEEDERARVADGGETTVAVVYRSRTMAPTYILKVINNFLLLLPRQIMSAEATGTCYEEYVQDASRHYQNWVQRTVDFGWPTEASFPPDEDVRPHDEELDDETHPSTSVAVDPQSSSTSTVRKSTTTTTTTLHCNDSGICEETFYEGPLLRLLFQHVRNMATHPYEFNLAVIAILSKLALLPHPFLHEILLNPEVPVARGTHTLWSSMQWLARQLLLEVPRHEGFQRKVAETGRRLLTNPPMISDSSDYNDPVFEALVVLEEFCKELAAIAFVKYHHATE